MMTSWTISRKAWKLMKILYRLAPACLLAASCSVNTVSVIPGEQLQFLVLCGTPHRCAETAKRICAEYRITWKSNARILEFRSGDSILWEHGMAIDCRLGRKHILPH